MLKFGLLKAIGQLMVYDMIWYDLVGYNFVPKIQQDNLLAKNIFALNFNLVVQS